MLVTRGYELDDYRWLISEQGQALLRQVEGDPEDDLRLAATLRRELSAARTHLVLEQRTLRRRALCKFPQLGAHMFFTPKLLEQASGAEPAAWKAARFAERGLIADLCCGLGGDSLALAGRADMRAIDRDPLACLLVEANLLAARRLGLTHSKTVVIEAEASPCHVHDAGAWHLDPDRRVAAVRTTRLELASPPPQAIDSLLAANPAGAIKLAPAAVVPLRWEEKAELEWLTSSGQCRQLVAWFGPLAQQPGVRRATALGRNIASFAAADLPMPGSSTLPLAERIGGVLYEPDPSVLAAGLAGALAVQYGLLPLDRQGGYLTADGAPPCGLLRPYEVLEWLPFDLKRLKAVLRRRRLGRIALKKRGIDHNPAMLLRQLAVPGDEQGVVILLRLQGRQMAAVCRCLSARVLQGGEA